MANRKNRLLTILMFAFILGTTDVDAQKTYFVYLQSDNQQPFYINIHGKNISSSAIGYVILPKLVDSTYPVRIGFPSGGPVQEFDLVVNGNDQGFIIKDFGEKGFGLFNLQSLSVQMNVNGLKKQKEDLAKEEKRVNDSLAAEALLVAEKQKADSIKLASEQEAKKKAEDSISLAKAGDSKSATGTGVVVAAGTAVAGPAINNNQTPGTVTEAGSKTAAPAVVVAAPMAADISKSPDSAKKDKLAIDTIVLKDSSVSNVIDTTRSIAKDTSKITKPVDSTAVGKKEEKSKVADSSAVGKSQVSAAPVGAFVTGAAVAGGAAVTKTAESATPNFLDMELGGDSAHVETKTAAKDTLVAGTILKDSTHVDSAAKDSVAPKQIKDTTVKTGGHLPDTSSVTGSITMNTPNAKIVAPVVGVAGVTATTDKSSMVTNASCKKIAGEKDFYAVRKKMVASDDPAQMILAAKSAFREKCYNNEQLRNLCVLFLDDASRYRFLDEAYQYSTDPQSYKQLGDLLKDEYYNRRFNAMLK